MAKKVLVGLLLFVVSFVAILVWIVDEAGSRRRAAERHLKWYLQDTERCQWKLRSSTWR